MVTCRTLQRIRAILQRTLVDAVVVDVLAVDPAAVFALVTEYAGIPFFALSAFRPDDGVLLAACRDAGLRGVFVTGVDLPVAGELVGGRTTSRALAAALQDAPRLLRLTEQIQTRAWSEILARVGTPTSTSDVALLLGHSREHLSREFAAGGAPNLKRVIDLVRAACAAHLLSSPGYDIATAARVLHYSSSSHFAGAARRIAGARPSELGRLGAHGVLLRFLRGRTRSRI